MTRKEFEARLYDALWALDSDVLTRMKQGDPAEYARRVDFCAQLWQDGRRFTDSPNVPFALFRTESCDEDAEIEALAASLIDEFRQKNVDRWFKAISRDDAQRMIDVLDRDPVYTHSDASVSYGGVTFPLQAFAERWNAVHGAERYSDTVFVKPDDNDFSV